MLKKISPEKLEILYMDTDSFFYAVKQTADVYNEMNEPSFKQYLDTSDYPKNHILWDDKNKKEIGKMKDEVNGKIIEKFCGLGSKMYSLIIFDNGKVIKKAKGVVKSVTNKRINFDDYKKVLDSQKKIYRTQRRIISKNHRIGTYQFNKVALSSFDDKRFIRKNNIHTLAHGHRKIINS